MTSFSMTNRPFRPRQGRRDRADRLARHREEGLDFLLLGSGAALREITVGACASLADCTRAIGMAGIKPVIGEVFSFDQTGRAFEHLRSARHVGMVVVRVTA